MVASPRAAAASWAWLKLRRMAAQRVPGRGRKCSPGVKRTPRAAASRASDRVSVSSASRAQKKRPPGGVSQVAPLPVAVHEAGEAGGPGGQIAHSLRQDRHVPDSRSVNVVDLSTGYARLDIRSIWLT
jgi:hypothetical protein